MGREGLFFTTVGGAVVVVVVVFGMITLREEREAWRVWEGIPGQKPFTSHLQVELDRLKREALRARQCVVWSVGADTQNSKVAGMTAVSQGGAERTAGRSVGIRGRNCFFGNGKLLE